MAPSADYHYLRALLNSLPDMVWLKDAEGKFTLVNSAVADACGYGVEELIGKTDRDIWPPAAAAKYMADDREVMQTGARKTVEEQLVDVRGETRWIETVKTPIYDDGGVVGTVGIARDITERKRAEEQIRKLNDDLNAYAAQLKGANQELEAFSYSLTHDLRRPLTIINGYAQALQEICGKSLDEECKRFVAEIYEATLRMNALIDAVLRLSLVTRGELRPQIVDLTGLAEKVAAELQMAEKERKVVFHIARGVIAHGDPNLLRVVMENLLGNAWKYTGRQAEAVIEFGVQELAGIPTYFVRDNGIGFDMSEADKLFVPFKRLDGAAAFKGEGIGLATVERITKRHGGRVWAESEPGKGATFFFQLAGQEIGTPL